MLRLIVILCALFAASCSRNSQTWEDVKTAGRYMQRGVDSAFGKDYESRQITSYEDFYGPYDDDFIPLSDADLRRQLAGLDAPLPQPRGNPGQNGIPSLDAFYTPPASLQALFRTVHFDTDDHVVRDKNELTALLRIASFLKDNPHVFVTVDGHTDERASASYNMALGMRRAHFVRSFLVKHGADLNQIFTVSRGKEHPLVAGHSPEDWKLNRRSEFRMYQQ